MILYGYKLKSFHHVNPGDLIKFRYPVMFYQCEQFDSIMNLPKFGKSFSHTTNMVSLFIGGYELPDSTHLIVFYLHKNNIYGHTIYNETENKFLFNGICKL